MKRNTTYTLVLAGASFCFLGGMPGAAQSQSTPQTGGAPTTQQPGSNPSNGAMTQEQNSQMQNAPDAMHGSTKMTDQQFVKQAAIGGITEVDLGNLAQQKSSTDAVKQLGQKLVQDHTKANDELKQIAAKNNLSLPDALDAKHQKVIDKLSKLSGPAFDKAFSKTAVKDHEEDVKMFKQEAQNGKNPDIKNFASETTSVLEGHLTAAKALQ